MATTIRELLVRLGVDADTKKVAKFDKALDSTKRTLVAVAGAAVFGAGALLGLAVATAKVGDEAAKAGQRVGLTSEEIQELGFAAQLAGADMTSIEVAFRRQAVAARDALKSALSPAALAYKKIGVNVRDTNGKMKEQIQIFEDVADGLKGLKTDTERMAIANDLFGRGGSKILPLLNLGAKGIREMRQQAQELGFVLDEEATKSSEDFVDAMLEMRAVLSGVRNQLGVALIPIFTRFVDRVRDWFLTNGQVIRQRIDKVIDGITKAVAFLDRAFEKVNKRVETVGGWGSVFDQVRKVIAALAVAFGISRFIKFLGIVQAIVGGIGAMASAVSGPVLFGVGLLAAALLSVLLVGEDFLVFLRGGRSMIGSFLASFGLEQETRQNFLKFFASATKAGSALVRVLLNLVALLGPTEAELARVSKALEPIGMVVGRAVIAVLVGMNVSLRRGTRLLNQFAEAIETPRKGVELFVKALDEMLDKLKELTQLKGGAGRGLVSGLFGAKGGLAVDTGLLAGRGIVGRLQARLGQEAAASAPTLAGTGVLGGSTSTTTVGDTNITIHAGSADAKEVAAEVAKEGAAARRKAFAAAQGGER